MVDIIVTEKFFDAERLFGTLYLAIGEFAFPCVGWTDFAEDILSAWARELLRQSGGRPSRFTLHFMDGPYALDISKDGAEDLAVRCMDHGRTTYQFACGYDELLDALARGLKSLNRVLSEQQTGPFTPAVAHNNMLAGKLAAVRRPTGYAGTE